MKFSFVSVSSKTPPWLAELSHDYGKKISFWIPSEIQFLRSSGQSRDNQDVKKKEDSQSILDFIKDDDFVLLCDEKGKQQESREFAKKFEGILNGGKKRIVFVVGGAYGVSDEIKTRADFQMSLSSLVMNHHLAMAVILEQIYRAMTILKNVSYHND